MNYLLSYGEICCGFLAISTNVMHLPLHYVYLHCLYSTYEQNFVIERLIWLATISDVLGLTSRVSEFFLVHPQSQNSHSQKLTLLKSMF
jgi:hypothetical protein